MLLVFPVVLTFAPNHAELGGKCQNRNTRVVVIPG
jgi:hypothetical protein